MNQFQQKEGIYTTFSKEKIRLSRNLSYGRKAICINNKWGFVDSKGSIIIKPQYDLVYDFNSKATAVLKNHKWHVIDRYGKDVSNLAFDYFGAFINNKAKVILNNKYNFIDQNGKLENQIWILLFHLKNQPK